MGRAGGPGSDAPRFVPLPDCGLKLFGAVVPREWVGPVPQDLVDFAPVPLRQPGVVDLDRSLLIGFHYFFDYFVIRFYKL